MVEIYRTNPETLNHAERRIDRAASRITATTAKDTATSRANIWSDAPASTRAIASNDSNKAVSRDASEVYRINLKVRTTTNDTVRRLLNLIA